MRNRTERIPNVRVPLRVCACIGFLLPGLLLLGACGGNNVDWPLNASQARVRAGGDVPSMTPAQIRAKIKEISGKVAANPAGSTVYIRDLVHFPDGRLPDIGNIELVDEGAFDAVQPVMAKNGITLSQIRSRENQDPSISSFIYGAVLDYSFFSVQQDQPSLDEASPNILSLAIGAHAGSQPPVNLGSATWSGVAVGRDISDTGTRGNIIQGDATLTLNFDQQQQAMVNVLFNNLQDLKSSSPHADMRWDNLGVTANGAFADRSSNPSIQGSFYGPAHEEAVGVFERASVLGAFGAKR